MGRKVFLTFLGTGNYVECVYQYDNQKSNVVKYIQSALVNILASDYDKYFAFCTKEASKKHFEGLNKECYQKFEKVDIPQGIDEAEIWEIFRIVFEKLNENDEVIFDITHSFRSIPMLGITLLQYAKFIKNIQVKGIYYGAFEAHKTVESNENTTSIIAPILNLTSFSTLQDWTIFGSQFINTGNVNNLAKIAETSSNQILKNTEGQNIEAKKLKKISKLLKEVGNDFSTNRGNAILLADKISEVKNIITDLEKDITIPAFNPILEKLNDEFRLYDEDNEENLLLAVKWCIDKGLVQQGITQLQEATTTILCRKIERDYKDLTNRQIITAYMSFGYNKKRIEWGGVLENQIAKDIEDELIEYFGHKSKIEEIAKAYNSLTSIRNDINHGGFTEITPSHRFQDKLIESYEILKKLK